MSLYDLTGNKVSFTYGRLVQIASGSYYDGFGNPLNLSGSGTTLVTGSTYPITSSWSQNTISASYALTASYALNGGGGIDLVTGSTYPITSSWSNNVVSASYALTASYALNGGAGGTTLVTGSTYPITSSWAITASYCLNSQIPTVINSVSASFYSSSVWEFTHSLNASPILVQTYDINFNQIIPQNILLLNLDVTRITFPISASGYAIASISGIQIISSSAGTSLVTGSTYPITSSWANNVVSASYSLTSSYSNNSTSASYSISSSYSLSSSYALTASYSDFAATSISSQNAQDILIYVKNTSGAIIPKGKVVRIVGVDNSGNVATIELADFTNENNSANTLGFTNQSFNINEFGYVMTEGYLLAVDTGNFTSADLLYLSSSGNYTNVKPIPPNHGVRLGQVIRSQQNNGKELIGTWT